MADTALVIAALALAVALRLVYLILFEKPADEEAFQYVRRDAIAFAQACVPLTAISLTIFWMSGFYHYGKRYVSRFKALVIARAVTFAYLGYGFAAYFVSGGDLQLARTVLPLGWILTILALTGARVWTETWRVRVDPERTRMIRQRAEGKRVLVIGGAGYIGSALIPMLLAEDYRVRLLDILLFGEEPIANFVDHPKLELIRGDFRNIVTIFQAMQDVDIVVHLGAIVGDPACNLDGDLSIDVNLISTRVIAELAHSCGVERFIFASTCSVYGASDSILDETSEVRPISLYGRTKLASERVLLDMASHKIAPTILRFATIYGFSGRTRFDLVVNLLTAKAQLEGEITVHGGDQWRPFVHVEDAAKAIKLALSAPKQRVAGEIFNVGSDEQNFTINGIARVIQEQIPDARVSIADDIIDNRNYRVSFEKIRSLGFEPGWTIEQGIQQVQKAIEDGNITDYQSAEYSNAKFLTEEGAKRLSRDSWAHELINDLGGR